MRLRQTAVLGVLGMLAVIQPTRAAVILDQPGVVDGSGAASGGARVAFEDFELPQADTVTSISWYGAPVPLGMTFDISFSISSTAAPGLPNLTPFMTETVTPTFSNTGFDTSIFTVTLPTSVALPASTYLWISIVGPGDDPDNGNTPWEWYQASAVQDPGALASGESLSYNGSFSYLGVPLSFELIGAPTVVTPTPEPASFVLLGTALVGLGATRSRKCGARRS